jgi:hypothetical protein
MEEYLPPLPRSEPRDITDVLQPETIHWTLSFLDSKTLGRAAAAARLLVALCDDLHRRPGLEVFGWLLYRNTCLVKGRDHLLCGAMGIRIGFKTRMQAIRMQLFRYLPAARDCTI